VIISGVRGLVRVVLGQHLARLAFSACLQIRYDCTVILTVSVSSVLEVQYQHNYHAVDKARRQGWVVLQ